MIPTGSSSGAITVRATTSQRDQKRRAEQRRRRQHDPVIRADHQAHECGTMMPMKPTGPPTETAAPVASDALRKATRWARDDVEAARLGRVRAEAQQVQRPRQPRERRERDRSPAAAPRRAAGSC